MKVRDALLSWYITLLIINSFISQHERELDAIIVSSSDLIALFVTFFFSSQQEKIEKFINI